ncbi:VWA domain-containing protein [Phormidium sp. CLA17]|uniref:VWA domain-containing protein n=1 Tax=Leptolyngbya sp. Cla-17 TaxID=2803751 RepID=UPI001491DCFB|nr:VWA domain-containing protein [Leptolyngbya sp. Cla-17]MBM0744090.1 VWA domain-containing protein [Leptolyngbya sp. Cla-17]
MDELPLLELFTRLREAGLPLGIPHYEAAVQALQKGYGLPDRAALARLCQTLWVRSSDEQRLFNYYFEQLIGKADISQPDKVDDETTPIASPQRKKRLIALYSGLISLVLIGAGVVLWHNTRSKDVKIAPSPSSIPTHVPVAPTASASPTPQPTVAQQPSSNGLIWVLLLILALSAGVFWLVKILLQRRHKEPEQASEPISENSAKLAPELLREAKDAVQVAQAVQQITHQRTNSRDRFLLSTDYLPVTQRQMKQSWRHLRRMVREGMATELDVAATVQRIAHDGMLLNPVLVARRINRTELVLLMDQDGSMVPFHSLSARLVETALRGGRLGKAGAYYFHNCPVDYLYNDPMHQEAEPIEEVLRGFQRDRTAVLIFSDAGAARGGLNLERADLTAMFLQQLKQQVRYVAWLNPMPKPRWNTSTAREIALQVPMFEATRQGLDEAIDALRGRHHALAALLGGQK